MTDSFITEIRRDGQEDLVQRFVDERLIEITGVSDGKAGPWLTEVSKFSMDLGISFADATALVCAKERGAFLLSSYGKMKGRLAGQGIAARGVIWVLDMLLVGELLTFKEALASLENIQAEGGCIPKRLCARRRNSWKNGKKIGPVGMV
ncbi:MAG: hypothetical protein KDN20_16265 [Verrucomicrobiae bacterium]|nr:hypothetical protein [Verrucomicrobiae bacterium]